MITFNKDSRFFHLSTKNTSYVFGVYQMNHLIHLYWGAKIPEENVLTHYLSTQRMSFSARDDGFTAGSTDNLTMEYPTFGSTDLRSPAFDCVFADGSRVPQLRYYSHKIYDGKPKLEGLPATYCEEGDKVQTLEVELVDSVKDLHVFLNYSVFEDYDVITRSVRVENRGEKCKITTILSASVDLNSAHNYDFIHLDGAWAKERAVNRQPLFHGKQSVDSKRGATSAHHNCFVALSEHNANETMGEVYSMNLVYSGNFEAGCEVDSYDTGRMFIGINPFEFGWTLENGETFQSPEAVLVYSNKGLGAMSRIYHKLYRERLCRGKFRDIERYALINNWEATYMRFNEEKLLAIAEKAKDIGLDLFVLDDGWFGKRDVDNCSLGDWVVYKEKLPNGLSGLAQKLNALGLKFGLWVEPEMVSPNSDLYRAHPDWALQTKGRVPSTGRTQLVLDLSRKDVREFTINWLTEILSSANIEYIKWDMNRNMTEVGSLLLSDERQSEVYHRYILGLYEILETITSRFPNILFESCSGGGGRFDPGMLHYMPQTWTSDDSDAVERVYIQYGTSMCYPYSAMGAHVSACPNHQVRRTTPFEMRGHVALPGQFGFELDLSKLTDEEIEIAKQQVKEYKEFGAVFHRGDCYRLISPFESHISALNFVSEDKNTVILLRYRTVAKPNEPYAFVKLQGLEPDAIYVRRDNGARYSGAFLMNAGIPWEFASTEYQSAMTVFDKQ